MRIPLFTGAMIILLMGCAASTLPEKKLRQFEFAAPTFTIVNNTLEIYLQNPVKCPLRVWIINQDDQLQSKLRKLNPIVIKETSDTLVQIPNVKEGKNFSYGYRLGSVTKKIKNIKVELPFPLHKEYSIVQGNNSGPTHNTDWSRYAVDFSLKTNDTICAATNGFVVGVVDKYKYGGVGSKWMPFGNFITIYDPNTGIFTQYVHLVHNGSLVSVGDKIESGQPIALSGKTGQTNIEHLHFSCLVPVNNNAGLESIPFEFVEGYKSEDLQRNDVLTKTNYDYPTN